MRKVLKGQPGKRYFLKLLGRGPFLPCLRRGWMLQLFLCFQCLSCLSCFISDSGGQDYVETVIPSNQLPSAAFFSETQRQFSRYFIEFEELQLLGKGAFGAVIKV